MSAPVTVSVTRHVDPSRSNEMLAWVQAGTSLAERFDGLQSDPQTHALVASAVAAEQVMDLVERGVSDFHFYTMNRADLAFAICHMIGIRAAQDVPQAATSAAA